MPHSVSPEGPASPNQDEIVEEPKPDNIEREGTAVAESIRPIRESQNSDDQDMTMADTDSGEENTPVKTEITPELKLEDLFADIDSDEEFPCSTSQDVKTPNSPEAPESPL
jgi:DNA primase small subunit